ncbi:hypothetical protein C7D74_33465, partial [Klebsiella pneumoniae]
ILTAAAFTVAYQQALRILLQQKTLTLVLMGALLAGAILTAAAFTVAYQQALRILLQQKTLTLVLMGAL